MKAKIIWGVCVCMSLLHGFFGMSEIAAAYSAASLVIFALTPGKPK